MSAFVFVDYEKPGEKMRWNKSFLLSPTKKIKKIGFLFFFPKTMHPIGVTV